MNAMTECDLVEAFDNDSMGHMRCLHWAALADSEAFSGADRLFRTIAAAEPVDTGNRYPVLKDVARDCQVPVGCVFRGQNAGQALRGGTDGERFEIDQIYAASAAMRRRETRGRSGRSAAPRRSSPRRTGSNAGPLALPF